MTKDRTKRGKAKKIKDLDPKNRAKNVRGGAAADNPRRDANRVINLPNKILNEP